MSRQVRLRCTWRRFNPSNEPGTCLWCGVKLRPNPIGDEPREEADLGAYWDNAFCTMRCGYQFGANMAELGYRLHGSGRRHHRLKPATSGEDS